MYNKGMGIVGGLFFHVTAGISSSSVIIGKRVHQKSQRGQGVDAGGCRGLGSHRLKGIEAEAIEVMVVVMVGLLIRMMVITRIMGRLPMGRGIMGMRRIVHHDTCCHIAAVIIIVFNFGTRVSSNCRYLMCRCSRGCVIMLANLPFIM